MSTNAREELATLQCTLGSMKAYQVGASCGSLKGLHSEIIYEYLFVIGEFGGSGTLAGCGSGDAVQ